MPAGLALDEATVNGAGPVTVSFLCLSKAFAECPIKDTRQRGLCRSIFCCVFFAECRTQQRLCRVQFGRHSAKNLNPVVSVPCLYWAFLGAVMYLGSIIPIVAPKDLHDELVDNSVHRLLPHIMYHEVLFKMRLKRTRESEAPHLLRPFYFTCDAKNHGSPPLDLPTPS